VILMMMMLMMVILMLLSLCDNVAVRGRRRRLLACVGVRVEPER
jgi:hypothetical protein